MSKKHENPYRAGVAYAGIFDAIRASGNSGVSRDALVEKGFKAADITVVLSPRKASKRGDCRGNMSAQGHIYCVIPLKGEAGTRFRLSWRDPEMKPRERIQGEVKAKKVAKKASDVAKTDASNTPAVTA